MESKEIALFAAKTLTDKKGRDIILIEIMGKAIFADYMILATGDSGRQTEALADYVEDALAKKGVFVKSVEGRSSGWILMDYRDVIVNVLTREMREKYNIEKVWGDCPFLNLEENNI